jgi:heme/copper-type cytochrome/quinol oxidase subunit 3
MPGAGGAVSTAVSDAQRPSALARETPAGRSPAWWGMVLFLLTDLTVFAALIASYFYLRFAANPTWPPPGIEVPKLLKPAVLTGLLVSSSVPLIWADLGIKKGDRKRLIVGLLMTIALGCTFLFVQYTEYDEKLAKYKASTNAYGSLFYTLTGWHGFHVLVGVLVLVFVLAAAASGRITKHHHARVRVIALFWHTVDAVWIAIVLTVYVSNHL